MMRDIFNWRVLLVDDNAYILNAITSGLGGLGCSNVEDARSVEEAKEKIEEFDPDFLVIDHLIGQENGVELVRWIRGDDASKAPFVPILLLLEQPSIEDLKAARDCGVNELLTKPFTATGLLRRIENVASRPRTFIRTDAYCGPDRRRPRSQVFAGAERRAYTIG